MAALRVEIKRFASTPFPVLVQGESGTGKELVAAALHEGGQYAGDSFVSVNRAALTPDLMEAQLFGHAKGAFTGAPLRVLGSSKRRMKGPCFLMRSASFLSSYSRSFCVCWKMASTTGLAKRVYGRPLRGLSPPQTATLWRRFAPVGSATTCTTA